MGCVYIATNIKNGKVYIGMTKNSLEKRIKQHYSDSSKESMNYFHRALKKYGEENFEWEKLFINSDPKVLGKAEIYYISSYCATDKNCGYNICSGGQGSFIMSEDYIEAHLKGENNPFYGKHHSKETGEKIIESNKRRSGSNHHFYGKVHPNKGKSNNIIHIKCIETNEIFTSVNSAHKKMNICRGSISKSLKDCKAHSGFTFILIS